MELLLLPLLAGGALLASFLDFGSESDDLNNAAATEVDPFEDAIELTNGANYEIGTDSDDVYEALNGDDTVKGQEGDDCLFGNDGKDVLYGGNGRDILIGDDGGSSVNYGDMRDVLKGGNGDDILIGNGGEDGLFGNNGDDMIMAGDGADRLFGSNGMDTMEGHYGSDYVRGGDDNDIVSGNMLYKGMMTAHEAHDLLHDSSVTSTADIERLGDIQQRDDFTADTVYGDAGDDILLLGDKDTGVGGYGYDTFYVSPYAGTYGETYIKDYTPGEDKIILQYNGDTPPAFSLGDDGEGNATVHINGKVVINVASMAGVLSPVDIALQPL